MVVFQETISMRINNDFSEFLTILKGNLDMQSCQDEHINYIEIFHKSIYIYKEIVIELSLNDLENSLLYDSLNSLMECLVCIIQGKYKLASMAIRGSMETYAKALVSMIHESSTDKFSNNIEIVLSKVSNNIRSCESLKLLAYKNLKKSINTIYSDQLKNEYWILSDIVHSRTIEYNSSSRFLEDVLTTQFVEETFITLLTKANLIIGYFIEVLLISNYKYLDSKMNYLLFNYITQNLSSDFNKIKEIYI